MKVADQFVKMLEEAGVIGPSNGSKPREVFITVNDLNSGPSGMPLHSRDNFKAPDNYFSAGTDEGDDGVLVFSNNENTEAEEIKEPEESEGEEIEEEKLAEDLLLSEEEVEDAIEDEDEILDSINEKEKEKKVKEEKLNDNPGKKELPFEEDDEMFFSR